MDLVPAFAAALVSASAVLFSEYFQRRFYAAYLQTHPKEPRQPPLVKMGLGLDDITYGPWDIVPAWRVLNRPVEPELVGRQRAARVALVFMPIFVIAGVFLLPASHSPATPIGWFAGLVIGSAFGWGSAVTVSRDSYDEGLDRTSRIVLRLAVALPLLAIVFAMLVASSYMSR